MAATSGLAICLPAAPSPVRSPEARGCLLELTRGGAEPILLPDGEQRTFLEDGDEVTLRAYCQRHGAVRIGFGECSGILIAAR